MFTIQTSKELIAKELLTKSAATSSDISKLSSPFPLQKNLQLSSYSEGPNIPMCLQGLSSKCNLNRVKP